MLLVGTDCGDTFQHILQPLWFPLQTNQEQPFQSAYNRTIYFSPTLQQVSVGESTKNMLKQRFPNFFHIMFEIESMN